MVAPAVTYRVETGGMRKEKRHKLHVSFRFLNKMSTVYVRYRISVKTNMNYGMV